MSGPPRDERMKVGFDATPLLGPRTGIGTYTERLVDALVRGGPPDLDLVATPFSRRGTDALGQHLPAGVGVAGRRLPARLLRQLWTRTGWPPVEFLSGPVDVFHGTNFVAPPTRHARPVVTIHDLAYLHLPETVNAASLAYRDLVPAALCRGATVCAVSETMATAIVDAYRLPPERVAVTPLGVDESWYAVHTADGPDRPLLPAAYVVAVGTLEPRKNLGVLLDAYRLAAARGTDLPPLVLVGAHGWGDALDSSGVSPERLVRTGRLPLSRLQQVVAGASLLAFPSRYEGFGLPPLEALAAGTPVLAADLAVTREVLDDQARFTDPGSAEAMLDGLVVSLADPVGTRETRQQRARGFTWERCAEATLQAYRLGE
jgi:glycosyltransferase involved in cell wall biosynthesis